MIDDRQPKDYAEDEFWEVDDEQVAKKFEQWWDQNLLEAKANANLFERFQWHLSNHPFITVIVSVVVGYLAGAYFGTFW